MKTHKKLWDRAFHDTKKYMDYYFSHKAVKSGVYSDYEEDELCAMAYFTPYQAQYMGKNCKVHYIVGVATKSKYRRQRRMTKLLSQGIDVCSQEGSPLVFLSPENPKVYDSLGFVGTYWRETTSVQGKGKSWYRVSPFCELTEGEKEKAACFSGEKLKEEKFELYLEHSKKYYEEVEREMKALEGGVLVLYETGDIVAVANYIQENGKWEITELICPRDAGKKVVETLCDYLKTEELTIDDSYFIAELKGEGISKKRQEKPYIMYKTTSLEDSPPLHCYINDIT